MIDDITPPQKQQLPKSKHLETLGGIGLSSKLPEPETTIAPDAVADDRTDAVPFKTPEEVAATEINTPDSKADSDPGAPKPHAPEKPHRPWYKLNWPPDRQQMILCAILLIVVGIAGGATWTLTHNKRAVVANGIPTKVKKVIPPKIIYSTLTGLPITDASLNSKPVTAVMVENSLDARPQSGLSEAGVVFEAVAEGGVTRFMAVYQDTAPTNVGPIRSARPYYVSWALGFSAAYAHVGGSDAGLSDITNWGVQDMNQFYNGSYFHRITTRDAPHNVYTGIDTLNTLEAAKGYKSTYTGFPRGKEAPAKTPTATSLDFNLSGAVYNPHYDYSATTNSYNRSENGAPQTDANNGLQLSPKVVIAIVVPLAQGALDSSGAYYSDYTTIGSGQAFIFQNGTLTPGTWTKADNNSQLSFTDANGTAIPLNPGQTWISAVSATNQVHYQ